MVYTDGMILYFYDIDYKISKIVNKIVKIPT